MIFLIIVFDTKINFPHNPYMLVCFKCFEKNKKKKREILFEGSESIKDNEKNTYKIK